MLKILVRPEIFIYIAILFYIGLFFILGFFTEHESERSLLEYYSKFDGGNFSWPVAGLIVLLFLRMIVFWLNAAIRGLDPAVIFSRANLHYAVRGFVTFLKHSVVIGIPFVFALYTLALALGELNVFNATRLIDERVLSWDIFLTHTFPSLSLASFYYPGWFVEAVQFSFMKLVAAFGLFAAYLFQVNQKLFREAAGAFFIGTIIMFIGWTLFPVMSPHDRFIDNVYNEEIPLAAQTYLENYYPQEEIAVFLENMRESKKDLGVMPTSAIPSAHVVWAVMLVYYAYRAHRWLAVLFLPLAVLSTFGTVLFAQHYFIDMPTGIITALVSIVIARYLAKRQTA